MKNPTGPLRVSRVATFWNAEGEVEQMPDASIGLKYMYEQLRVDLPEKWRPYLPNAKPYCWGLGEISFFARVPDAEGWFERVEIARCQHYGFTDLTPHLLCVEGTWYEATADQVIWRNDEWQMRFRLDARTRHAEWANGRKAAAE